MAFDARTYAWSRLQDGMRLFHAGDRLPAAPLLQQVLDTPNAEAAHCMAAAGLLAETYRGACDYLRATQYYELAISEGQRISPADQRRNEWYTHYQPRSVLGLAMVRRRTLDSDRRSIPTLLRDLAAEAPGRFGSDVPAQVQLVAGLYDRQMGDLESCCSRLREAIDDLKEQPLPYTFLGPDHAEALLAQSQLLAPESQFSAGASSEKVLKNPTASAWSRGISASVQLHLLAAMAFRSDPRSVEQLRERQPKIRAAQDVLDQCASEDGDAFLRTESCVMDALWLARAGALSSSRAAFGQLVSELDALPRAPDALVVLRAMESVAISRAFLDDQGGEAVDSLCERAFALEEGFSAAAARYGRRHQSLRSAQLDAEAGAAADWFAEPLQSARALAWP